MNALNQYKCSEKKEGSYDYLVNKLPLFKLSQIDRVYAGKPHMCMCGCSGDYYEMDSDDYKEHMKALRILDKVINFVDAEHTAEVIGDYIVTIYIGSKQYTIYLKQEVTA